MNLLPHQKYGVNFLLAREPNSLSKTSIYGSILADDMGLGKTIQTISLIDK
jgi:SNF2 family DNA or RNA helicase